MYPRSTEEPRYAGIGCRDNRHLMGLVESLARNLGGPFDDGHESGSQELETPPENLGCVRRESAWPSYSERGKAAYMGKGHRLTGASKYYHAPVYQGILVGRRKGNDGNGPGRRSPCAVKVARTVTTGGMGKHRSAVRPVPTHSSPGGKIFMTCDAY
jgi:hypothetical protein